VQQIAGFTGKLLSGRSAGQYFPPPCGVKTFVSRMIEIFAKVLYSAASMPKIA
jgi:hypothetical protein